MKIITLAKQQKKINTLENEIETLEDIMKDKLYTDFMKVIEYSEQIKKLKVENKILRKKIKKMKEVKND